MLRLRRSVQQAENSHRVCVPLPGARRWVEQRNKHCYFNKYSTRYSTLEAAKAACLELDSSCTGVYDFGCDGRDSFYLCKKGEFHIDGESQCIYSPDIPGWYNGMSWFSLEREDDKR